MHRTSIFAGAALALLLSLPQEPHAQDFTLRANTIGAEQGIQMEGLRRFKEVVEERSGGRVAVQLHHSGALGDQEDNIESMQAGTLDIATIESPITTVDPLLGVLALPYMFRDREHVAAVLDGEIGAEIGERLREHDLVLLGFYEGGFRQITNNVRPIVVPGDLEGVKMRTPGSALRIKIFNHYGASAAPLPYAELYSALQTGVFDGQENPLVEITASRFYEVQRYLSISNHIYTAGFILMSEPLFSRMPADLQELLMEAGREAGLATVNFGREADESVVEIVKQRGMVVNEVDTQAFIEASRPIWNEATADLGAPAAALIERIMSQ